MTDPVPSKELKVFDLMRHAGFGEEVDWINRLETALRGVQSCSTCEACRGAATLALGGAEPQPGLDALAKQYMETLDDEFQDEIYTTEWGFANRSIPKFVEWLKRAAQPPGDG
jgi:hypothetical protein